MGVKSSTQSSQSNSNGTSRSILKPLEGLPLLAYPDTIPEKSPQPSDFKLNDSSQRVLSEWSQAINYDLATTKTTEIPTQLIRMDLQSFPQGPVAFPQMHWSEYNDLSFCVDVASSESGQHLN